MPIYWLFELIPATRAATQRLGMVTLEQMLGALVRAVENPPGGVRVWEVPEIRGGVVSPKRPEAEKPGGRVSGVEG